MWRLLNDKIPSEDSIKSKGMSLASMGCLCNSNEETTNHLFFQCRLAAAIWDWFRNKANISFVPTFMEHWLSCCKGAKRNQASLVMKDAIVFIINKIWSSRNN